VRRKAIEILERASCLDGFWDSKVSARVGRIVVALEERDLGRVTCAADILRWARISAVDPKFDMEGRRAHLRYWKASKTDGSTIEDFEEDCQW